MRPLPTRRCESWLRLRHKPSLIWRKDSSPSQPWRKSASPELDSNQFMVREEANQELEKLGELALPACRQAYQNTSSVEVHRRLEAILERETRLRWNPPPAPLRKLRAVE